MRIPNGLYRWKGRQVMAVETSYEHIMVGEDGVAIIEGKTTKVVELVMETMAYGWSPEEIHLQHGYLTLGEIHSALAYYWDHKEELDKDIERRLGYADEMRKKMGQSTLVDKLKARGLV
jgi:uncharacterized protein (DUF433 family)